MIHGLDAVLFDLDGTLADTREDVWLSVEYAAAYTGGRIARAFRENPANLALPLDQIFYAAKKEGTTEELALFCETLRQHYRQDNRLENTRLYPGILQLLAALSHQGKRLFIVTMKPFQPTNRLLTEKGWARYFEGWLSPDGPGHGEKTKAQRIGELLAQGLSAERSIYVGDSWGDVVAARENGMRSIGVLYGDGDNTLLRKANPDYLAADGAELTALFFNKGEKKR